MDKCAFCPRSAAGKWAMTACNGDTADSASWRREILPLCISCERLIRQARDEGRLLKATGERWFGGHKVGRFEAKGVGGWNKHKLRAIITIHRHPSHTPRLIAPAPQPTHTNNRKQ